eukprot:3936158-Amphidinium_carterae.2
MLAAFAQYGRGLRRVKFLVHTIHNGAVVKEACAEYAKTSMVIESFMQLCHACFLVQQMQASQQVPCQMLSQGYPASPHTHIGSGSPATGCNHAWAHGGRE